MLLIFPNPAHHALVKAYIHGHYRLNAKTGQRHWVDSYQDKRPERGRTEFAHMSHREEHVLHHLAHGRQREALHAFHDLNSDDSHSLARRLFLVDPEHDAKDFGSKKALMEAIHGNLKRKREVLSRQVAAQVKDDFERRKAAGTVGKKPVKIVRAAEKPGPSGDKSDAILADFVKDRAPRLQNNQDRFTPEIAKQAFESWWNDNHAKHVDIGAMGIGHVIKVSGQAKARAYDALQAEIKRLDDADDLESSDRVSASISSMKAAHEKAAQESARFAAEEAAQRRERVVARQKEDEKKEREGIPREHKRLSSDLLSGHLGKEYRASEIAKLEARAKELGVALPAPKPARAPKPKPASASIPLKGYAAPRALIGSTPADRAAIAGALLDTKKDAVATAQRYIDHKRRQMETGASDGGKAVNASAAYAPDRSGMRDTAGAEPTASVGQGAGAGKDSKILAPFIAMVDDLGNVTRGGDYITSLLKPMSDDDLQTVRAWATKRSGGASRHIGDQIAAEVRQRAAKPKPASAPASAKDEAAAAKPKSPAPDIAKQLQDPQTTRTDLDRALLKLTNRMNAALRAGDHVK
ncbi:hypothetical protein, partial [Lamprocystis purpurea]|uniref:hypothetical protein n=1 Tax=Lamprocystis purpurea TaxID=61598 RepID=UPI00146B1E24